jgi:hypothetical protein
VRWLAWLCREDGKKVREKDYTRERNVKLMAGGFPRIGYFSRTHMTGPPLAAVNMFEKGGFEDLTFQLRDLIDRTRTTRILPVPKVQQLDPLTGYQSPDIHIHGSLVVRSSQSIERYQMLACAICNGLVELKSNRESCKALLCLFGGADF